MKLESFTDLYFVVSVLVPGFIYSGVISSFVPIVRSKEKEIVLLRFLTATSFNYAICSPLIYFLVFGYIRIPILQALCWFFIIFIVPIMLAITRARIIQRDWLGWVYRRIGLRAISPIPTGWDWVFSTTDPCFVLITLTDGTEIAGYFGKRSMASSDPEHHDIFVERVYQTSADDGPWQPVEGSLGMHVAGAQIAYIEFKRGGPDTG